MIQRGEDGSRRQCVLTKANQWRKRANSGGVMCEVPISATKGNSVG